MATSGGREISSVIQRLREQPQAFDFFQAVRLLELAGAERAPRDQAAIGYDGPIHNEVVRFRSSPSLTFASSMINELTAPASSLDANSASWEMTVSFMGLIGPQGVLPHHYTRLVIERLRDRDAALRDWLDIFHHRLLSHFYRAWKKYHFPVGYEQCYFSSERELSDQFTESICSVIGFGEKTSRHQFTFADEALLYYAGPLSNLVRNAASLEEILRDYFELPIEVEQFHGRWLTLAKDDRSRLTTNVDDSAFYNQLGTNVTVGDRVWDVQSKFRLRVGPINYQQFTALFPTAETLQSLYELTRVYVGIDLEFDAQMILLGSEVPFCQLTEAGNPRLGWNTWVRCQPFDRLVSDAVFQLEPD